MINYILKLLHGEFRDASMEHADLSDEADGDCGDEDAALEAGKAEAFGEAARRCRMIMLALATAEWLETP